MAQNPQNAQFHSFVDYLPDHPQGIVIPQPVYQAPPGTPFVPHQPIRFETDGGLGLPLQTALVQPIQGLHNAGTVFNLANGSNRHSIRILWPGYEPWNYPNALHTGPRTRAEIAHEVAGRVLAFHQGMVQAQGNEGDWTLQNSPFQNLYLIELRNVSKGSWQPVISRSV
ncbi:hypothetical protein PsYK624_090810 [Phanerochaete sordida]|uniref:Uncharacterized protein n=1 Tax=Phanerochaete sordida TaxID=48140 RepID=A0A9P3LGB7_9APHY|nr:hypothetical protein PsYK624_090810 [Phanerochaete sordida]